MNLQCCYGNFSHCTKMTSRLFFKSNCDTIWLHIHIAWARVQLRINVIGKNISKQFYIHVKISVIVVWAQLACQNAAPVSQRLWFEFWFCKPEFLQAFFSQLLELCFKLWSSSHHSFWSLLNQLYITVLDTCLIFFNFLQIILSSLALWLIFFSMCMFVTESSKECWYIKSCRIYQNSKDAISFVFIK